MLQRWATTTGLRLLMIGTVTLFAVFLAGSASAQGQGSVAGSVTSGGQGVEGVVIDLFEQAPGGARGSWLGDTRTDAGGRFGLETGPGCFVLTFIAPDGATFDDGERWYQPSVCVDQGETVTGVDAALAGDGSDNATFTGAVTDGRTPVASVVVDLFATTADGSRGRWLGDTTTGTDGRFTIARSAGCYVFTFIAPDGRTFSNNSPWYQPSACGTPGETVDAIDAALATADEPPTAGCLGAPALDPPSGVIVRVDTVAELQSAVFNADRGTTVLIAPGTYDLTQTLNVGADDVTIRGDSNDCGDVVIRGRGMDNADYGNVPHGVYTTRLRTAVQNLTITDVYYHSIALNPGSESPWLYNLRLLDSGEQFVKAGAGPSWGDGVDDGVVEYATIAYTDGTPRTDHGPGLGYTQGVDVHGGDDWVIRRNLFQNFHVPDDHDFLHNPVVLMWRGSRNTIVEGNVFVDVDRAIALGLDDDPQGLSHEGGRVTNNMIYYTPERYSPARRANSDAAIIIWDSPGAVVDHNTCLTNGTRNHCIEFRFDTTGAVVRNNLVDNSIGQRGGAPFTESGTRQVPAGSVFVDAAGGDLHLRDGIPNLDGLRVDRVAGTTLDLDGDPRPARTVAGADEPD